MKKFKTNSSGLFICEICGKTYKNKQGLSTHINKTHILKEYYDKFLKSNNEGFCEICHKPTKFLSIKEGGYSNFCSRKCITEKASQNNLIKYNEKCTLNTPENILKKKNKWLKTYGVDNPSKSPIIQKKKEQTMLKNYGVNNPSKSQKIQDLKISNNLKKYNVEHSFQRKDVKDKIKTSHFNHFGSHYANSIQYTNNNIKKFGTEHIFQNGEIKLKIKKTNIYKYGVEYPIQNIDIFNKALKSRRLIKQFKNTNLTYQGSYELDFLYHYYNKFNILNGPSLNYIYQNKNKVYHSDFYIPIHNLIVEIKSSYIITLDETINEKRQTCLDNGYNYILIVDKNYELFDKNFSIV